MNAGYVTIIDVSGPAMLSPIFARGRVGEKGIARALCTVTVVAFS
jgi:hypothetical protein